ncbi:hypothetical protein ASG80_01065 [Agromyces sp. Soil535]|nr:hypothetical protein ASG80_01065 [Agromyces sp. Soil535]
MNGSSAVRSGKRSCESELETAYLGSIRAFVMREGVMETEESEGRAAAAGRDPACQATDCIRALLAGTPLGDHLWLTLIELIGIIVVAFTATALLFRRRTRH